MNFNIITVLYNHQYYLIPEFFPYPDKETPHSLAEPHCHPSPVPWKPLIYSISVNCLFWTCRWNHAKVSLCIWLISLNLFSRFTLVVVSIRTLFLYRITIYLYGYASFLFIHHLIATWVVYIFRLLWVILLCKTVSKFLCGHMFFFVPLGIELPCSLFLTLHEIFEIIHFYIIFMYSLKEICEWFLFARMLQTKWFFFWESISLETEL